MVALPLSAGMEKLGGLVVAFRGAIKAAHDEWKR